MILSRRLLYIVSGMEFFSAGYRGRVMHALGICEGFIENGWDVTIIGGNCLSSFSDDMPSAVELIEVREPVGLLKYPRWWWRIFKVFREAIRNEKYDCIMPRYAVSSYLLQVLLAIFSPKNSKKVIEVNSFAYHMLSRYPQSLNYIVSRFEMVLINLYDCLYVVSDSMVSDRRNRGCRAKIISIPNGATSKKIDFSANSGASNERLRMVYLGTLMPYWDFKCLLSSINALHEKLEVDVIFLGDGPELQRLQSGISRRDLVTFYGRFSRNDLGKLLYKKTDILMLPPKTHEDMKLSGGLSTKLFDYLSMEMPIVAPSDGEINNILKHKYNSYLYKSNDPNSFVNTCMLALDSHLYREVVAKNAYNDFIDKYSWQSRMKILINLIEGQLGAKS